jgi:SOS-response transcriptional repressor LexA
VQPRPDERYVTCLPLIPLQVAAGAFGEPQHTPDAPEPEDWVAIDTGRKLRRGMFVAQVIGKSMEPKIPDGSFCVFATPVEGSRRGKIVLVQLRDQRDPESGARYTVKYYESEKTTDPDGDWRHVKITLRPANRDFVPIVLTTEDEDSVAVIAEFVQLL